MRATRAVTTAFIISACALARRVNGQQADSSRASRAGADVVLYAAVSAGEVRFAKQPQIHVQVNGSLDSVRVLERRNLPSPVVAGTTYRNVYVSVAVFGRLNAECVAALITHVTPSDPGHCASVELRASDTARTKPPTQRAP